VVGHRVDLVAPVFTFRSAGEYSCFIVLGRGSTIVFVLLVTLTLIALARPLAIAFIAHTVHIHQGTKLGSPLASNYFLQSIL
jgi:hypothetical protein